MWRRGANLQGDTANFIETEQLMEFDGFISSFLQVLLCQSMVLTSSDVWRQISSCACQINKFKQTY